MNKKQQLKEYIENFLRLKDFRQEDVDIVAEEIFSIIGDNEKDLQIDIKD